MTTVLVVTTAATWTMIGVIWMVQLVQYPQLARLSAVEPGTAAVDHQRRISWVVGPPMAVEGVGTIALLGWPPEGASVAGLWIAAVLLAVALGSTVWVQVPLHSRLAAGHDAEACRWLVRTNWIRTLAWTGRGVALALVLADLTA